jgi:predicted nucleic acid-binding protein
LKLANQQRMSFMKRIYFDTNQLFYIRRIADEAEGWDYGDYAWAHRMFHNNAELVQDIRALCYIVALQYEWELDFSASNASFSELCLRTDDRARATQEAWKLFAERLNEGKFLKRLPFSPNFPVGGCLSLDFIDAPPDRVILRHFASEGADVLLTCDSDILDHRDKLAKLNLVVMRPSEWVNTFLQDMRGKEDAVDWLERILFSIGASS